MKTEISRFCAVCSESLESLPAALQAAAEQCEQGGEQLKQPLLTLNDARARLRSLTDKLKSQQAYLLIFGPLKSGKSTLMNAISGTYVSEVTSLPGYPCLVFVQDAPEPRFSVTRYTGRESLYPSATVLNDAVVDAHHALAQQIRAAEQRGESFDPRSTFPEAIRRIDIKLPVPALAESSTVLVDTPGLYSRMNFGYDVLTREFRDSAACAVFVVKTDNLFLEQVFAEFNQLLGLFSRIFIVVNVDASKRDLAPDGTLQPSAESRNPAKILEAFTTLSMAGPMREAYQAGRVRIHAVDLLGAAAEFISGSASESTHRPAFDAFLKDLTEYLNSSDYTREFIRDSLRQARTICEEARSTATGPELQVLNARQNVLAEEMRQLDNKIAATDRLLRVDWAASFQPLLAEHAKATDEDIRQRAAQVREEMRQGLNQWFVGNESLASLPQVHWTPSLAKAAQGLSEHALERLHRLANRPHGGLQTSAEVQGDLVAAGFLPETAGHRALTTVAGADDPNAYKASVTMDSVPVHKTFVDWILFRGIGKVRRRLFGDDATKEIPSSEKAKRLREDSRAELDRVLEAAVSERFPARPAKHASDLAVAYVQRAVSGIQNSLRANRDYLAKERESRQVPFDLQAGILAAMEELETRAESVGTSIDQLAEQEAATLGLNQKSEPEPSDELVAEEIPLTADDAVVPEVQPEAEAVPEAIPDVEEAPALNGKVIEEPLALSEPTEESVATERNVARVSEEHPYIVQVSSLPLL